MGRPSFWLLVALTLARLSFIGQGDLKVEEAYYWDYAQHPSLSYFDHPPCVAWLIRGSTALLGDTSFAVRLPAVLLFTLSILLLHDMVRRQAGGGPALLAALLMNVLPTFTFHSTFLLPDAPLLFFWCLGLWAGWRLVESQDTRWWWLVGLATGLGMDSKYPALLIPLGLFLFLGRSRPRLVWCPNMLGSALLAIALFSPVVLWNVEHDFASFRFQGAERMTQSLSVGERLSSYALQLIMLGPVGFFALLAALFWAWRHRDQEHLRYLLCWSLPFLGLMVVVSLRRQVQLTWPMPGYVAATPLLALWLVDMAERGKRRQAWVLGLTICLFAAFFSCAPELTVWRPIAALNPLLNRADDVSDWREMAREVGERRELMPHPEKTFVAGHGYQVAAELAFCLDLPHQTLANNVLGQKALAFDFWENPQDFKGWDAVYVVYLQPTSGGSWRQRVELDPNLLLDRFEKVETAEIVTRSRGGSHLRQFHIYRAYGYRGLPTTSP